MAYIPWRYFIISVIYAVAGFAIWIFLVVLIWEAVRPEGAPPPCYLMWESDGDYVVIDQSKYGRYIFDADGGWCYFQTCEAITQMDQRKCFEKVVPALDDINEKVNGGGND